MREIDAATISAAVAKLAVQACCHLPADVRDAFRQRLDKEPSPVGRNILEQLLENADIAARDNIPICQDTGLAVVFAEVGQDVHITGGDFEAAIHEGVRRGYVDGYLRKSCVAEPRFERKNTGDNTPAVIHTRIVPGDGLTLRLAPKGAGSENKSVVKMLVPADGIEGVRKVVLDAVLAAGPNSCPPMVVGSPLCRLRGRAAGAHQPHGHRPPGLGRRDHGPQGACGMGPHPHRLPAGGGQHQLPCGASRRSASVGGCHVRYETYPRALRRSHGPFPACR